MINNVTQAKLYVANITNKEFVKISAATDMML